MDLALVEYSTSSMKDYHPVTDDEVFKGIGVKKCAKTRRQFLRQLGEKSTQDSTVHTYKHDLAGLIGFDGPSKDTDQTAHNEH